MEWLRDWIMQVAGIIVLGAVCDMVINEGEMKKYVKMVMGLVLIFAIIKPIVKEPPDFAGFELPQTTRIQAAELKERLDEKDRESLLNLYRQKLSKKVENEIYTKWKSYAMVDVTVEEKDGTGFGGIKGMNVEMAGDISENEIKEFLRERFGVDPKNIKVR